MNRRGFFAGLIAACGLGVVKVKDDVVTPQVQEYAHEHRWTKTPYVLVYGEAVVQRGPELQMCKCGALRIDTEQHRNAMLQRAYNEAAAASSQRVSGFSDTVVS